MGKKVGVSREERDLSYFKYYEKELARIPQDKIDILHSDNHIKAVKFQDRNLFLSGEDAELCQIGFGVSEWELYLT